MTERDAGFQPKTLGLIRAVGRRQPRGAVLLEAVLALAILLVMVGLVTGAMHRTTTALERMSARATAEDLAVSVLSEIEAGIRPRVAGGDTFDEPWERWTWQLDIELVADLPEVGERLETLIVRIEHMDSPVQHELRQRLWREQPEEQAIVITP